MTPHEEYAARRAARAASVAALDRRDAALANARTAVFVVAAATAWLAFGSHRLAGWWVAVPVAVFAILVVWHDRVIQARRRGERAVGHYQRALDRLDGKWRGRGEPGERFVDAAHPYARDLDLFGRGSLFELLCTARTRAGEDTLAAWLRHPAAPDDVRTRQGAVAELRGRLDLREELALLGDDLRAEVSHPEDMAAWGERAAVFDPRRWPLRVAALLLTAAALGAAVAWSLDALSGWWFGAAAAVEAAVYRLARDRLERVMGAIAKAEHDLGRLALVLARLEREPVTSARLSALQAQLTDGGVVASRAIAQLARLADLLLSMRNQFFIPIGLLLLWPIDISYLIEAWRAAHGRAIVRWLRAVGELEALAALSGYAYEHPDDPFPTLTDGAAQLDGEGLGHPLLPPAACVRNDVRLGPPRVLLVSGSNMSGKSTLLRTVGTNVVLALAGAPVCARRLTLTPLQVGATLRVEDSLADGTSRFYAEIKRLGQLVELARGPVALLFLLDEILHGTNSHDRAIGAQAVVRGLVERGAVGLVTTHDLALAAMEGADVTNVHFEDHLEEGRLTFDYRMRPGVVRKSNALELMRAVGLLPAGS